MRKTLLSLSIIALIGCSGGESDCVLEVNGATICIDGQASAKFCRSEWNGTASPADDATCEELGYAIECLGTLTNEGDNYTATYSSWSAATESDCTTSDGATFP